MISSASWRNRVCTRCDSASAVCFIGPQRPSCTIENDRSTQQRDGGRGAPLGLDDLEVLDAAAAPAGAGPPRRTALDTVRTASMRQLVAELPRPGQPGRLVGRAGAPVVVVAGAGGLDLREHPLQRGLAQPAYGARGQPQPVVAAGHEPLPLQLALQLAQRPQVGGRVGAELLLEGVHVDVVERASRGAAWPAAARAPRGRPGRRPPRRRRCSPAARRPAHLDRARGPARAAARAGCPRAAPSARPGRGRTSPGSSAGRAARAARGAATPSSGRRRPAAGPARRSARRRSPGSRGTSRRACP